MSPLAPALSGQFRRSPLVALGFFLFMVLAAYQASRFILSGDTASLILAALFFSFAVIVVAMLNDWRNGLYFFLVWLLFEDFARKYLGNNMAIYFGKDLLAAVVYLSFFGAYRNKGVRTFRPPFLIPLLLFLWFGVMQVFNPASASFVYGALGMKLYFYYMPLIFVGYALFETEADLRKFFSITLMIGVLIISLGIVQSILGHTFLNPARPADDIRDLSQLYRIAPISGLIAYRPNSVFVSAGRFTNFLTLSWLLAFGFSGYLLLRHRGGRKLAFVALAVTFAGVALCGSRGVLIWVGLSAVVGAVAFLWGSPWRNQAITRILRTLQRTALGGCLAMVVLMFTYPEALLSRIAIYTETLSPTSSASELTYRARDYPIENFLKAFQYDRWPYGFGIGTASLGVQYVSRIMQIPPMGIGVENGYGGLIVEMGIGGLALWLILSSTIIYTSWKVVRKLKGSPWFPLGFMIFWYVFLLLFPMMFASLSAYQDFVLNAFLWLLLGILFRLPSLALSAQLEVTASHINPQPRWVR
jgi:hypothetical protein